MVAAYCDEHGAANVAELLKCFERVKEHALKTAVLPKKKQPLLLLGAIQASASGEVEPPKKKQKKK